MIMYLVLQLLQGWYLCFNASQRPLPYWLSTYSATKILCSPKLLWILLERFYYQDPWLVDWQNYQPNLKLLPHYCRSVEVCQLDHHLNPAHLCFILCVEQLNHIVLGTKYGYIRAHVWQKPLDMFCCIVWNLFERWSEPHSCQFNLFYISIMEFFF